MKYIHRTVERYILAKLGKGKAIIIYGPRQAGKTTLVRQILKSYTNDEIASYQTDDPAQAAIFQPNVEVLRRIVGNKKILFIDEAQAIENAGLVMKLLVDNFINTQIIATGSSSFELSDKIKESMVGRVFEVTLLPLSADEIAASESERLLFDQSRMMKYGSYPGIVGLNDNDAQDLLVNIANSYLYKDVLSYADTRNPQLLRKLLTALALQVGQEVSFNELAGMLEVSRPTIERYIYLLEQCFVIYRLDPLSSNPRKLLASRKRKIYFYDLGIRNVLAGQFDIPLELNQQLGGLFENFCVIERLKSKLNNQIRNNSYYWRSPDTEIDYIETAGQDISAYELKWNKIKLTPPKLFIEQYPQANYTSINKDNYWDLIDHGK